jgi:hypothetical protein
MKRESWAPRLQLDINPALSAARACTEHPGVGSAGWVYFASPGFHWPAVGGRLHDQRLPPHASVAKVATARVGYL